MKFIIITKVFQRLLLQDTDGDLWDYFMKKTYIYTHTHIYKKKILNITFEFIYLHQKQNKNSMTAL